MLHMKCDKYGIRHNKRRPQVISIPEMYKLLFVSYNLANSNVIGGLVLSVESSENSHSSMHKVAVQTPAGNYQQSESGSFL